MKRFDFLVKVPNLSKLSVQLQKELTASAVHIFTSSNILEQFLFKNNVKH